MMRSRSSLRARWSAVLLAAVAVSGCSTGDAKQGRTDAPDAGTQAAARVAAAPLTVDRLAKLTLRKGEVPDLMGDQVPPVEELPPGKMRQPFPPVSKPECRPLIDVSQGKEAVAVVSQSFQWVDGVGGWTTISAYRSPEEAQRAFTRLEKAAAECRSFEGEGWTGRFWATVTTDEPLKLGDQAMSFRQSMPMSTEAMPVRPGTAGAVDHTTYSTAVRTGAVIAVFRNSQKAFPRQLMATQIRRLHTAQQA
ncbi:hypothetical protein [Streptomyces sp. NBC_00690]|uniref:hypothetical protein n=1 Tax=Streptomyces sp. NBC_00690 TaxID=2975808 RepID=UPI002E2D801C|nr:hypothetical protein [Streptomyces sp. NBC_00690]